MSNNIAQYTYVSFIHSQEIERVFIHLKYPSLRWTMNNIKVLSI